VPRARPQTLDLPLLSRGACAARARELKTTASQRRVRSDRGSRCVVSARAHLPPSQLPLLRCYRREFFHEDLARGKQGRSPRRNFRGAERPSIQLSLKRGGPRRHTCPPVPALRGLVFQHALGKGERGESPAQKCGAVCADRLAEKRTPRASGAFNGAAATVPNKRESPLRQSEDPKKIKKTSCRSLAAPSSRIKGMGSYPSLQRVE
jgi:hypothetical protein